jgi:hypothetical protein
MLQQENVQTECTINTAIQSDFKLVQIAVPASTPSHQQAAQSSLEYCRVVATLFAALQYILREDVVPTPLLAPQHRQPSQWTERYCEDNVVSAQQALFKNGWKPLLFHQEGDAVPLVGEVCQQPTTAIQLELRISGTIRTFKSL